MRAASFIVGILGGLAGLGAHAVLLGLFFSRSHGLFQVFLELVIALILGLAALLVAALCRRRVSVLAVYLPMLGVLGFFPRPLSWLPAGILLVAAGALAAIQTKGAPHRQGREVPGAVLGPDGTALHWSEAIRLGIPSAAIPSAPAAPRDSWTRRGKVSAAVLGSITAAIVVTLSLGTITINDSPALREAAAATTASTAEPGAVAHSDGRGGVDTTSTTDPPPTTTAMVPPDDDFAWYTDEDYGFTIKFPMAWRNTDPKEVGQRVYREYAEAYDEAFAPVAFADWGSPTFNGCYLDFIWVEVYDADVMEVPTIPEFRNITDAKLDFLQSTYAGVVREEPQRDVTIAGMRGFKHVWSILYGGRTLMLMECILAGEDQAYFLQFAAVKDDWETYVPVFEEILLDFTVGGPRPVS